MTVEGSLAGRIALVTGASRGLGFEIARRMAEQGARVWLNDTEIGTTPAEADFRFYGRYDIRLEKEGYEPLWTDREAKAPLWQYPGIDLAADLIPARFDDLVEWHFELEPSPETVGDPATVRRELIDRARSMRDGSERD